MSSEMDLADTLTRHAGKVRQWIETVVGCTDVDIVDVEQEEAIRAPTHLGQEVPLVHFVVGKAHVGRGVFEQQRTFEYVLCERNIRADHRHGFLRECQWQEALRIAYHHSRPPLL